jgi:hypothetical protein
MDRLNHVKLVSPQPEEIDRFLRKVVEVPEGWPLTFGSPPPDRNPSPPPAKVVKPDGTVNWDDVMAYRGDDGTGGFITGSTESRQFQILRGGRAHVWGLAIGTRHVERAHTRCVERGIPCSEVRLVDWNEKDNIRAFFAEVGGIIFEVMRVESKAEA